MRKLQYNGKIIKVEGKTMKNRDKVLVAFLASLGLFSVVQATQYVSTLSGNQKQLLMRVTHVPNQNITVCDGGTIPAASSTRRPNNA